MHHTLAWRVSAADTTETDITPVTDGIWTIQNSHFLPGTNWSLLTMYAGAATPSSARLVTPTFRQITTPYVRPLNTDIVPGNLPGVADYRNNPLTLRALEEIQLLATQASGGAAVIAGVACVSQQASVPMPSGDIYTLQGTGTTTCVAGSWTQCAMTWQDTLPQGVFAVVGGQFIGATPIAGRIILEDQVNRPGGLGTSAVDLIPSPIFQKGGLGIWGRFNSNRMPNVEFLCNAADTAQTVYLDIIRVQ
jgi:hypothetical protein